MCTRSEWPDLGGKSIKGRTCEHHRLINRSNCSPRVLGREYKLSNLLSGAEFLMELSFLTEVLQLQRQPVPPTSCHYVGSSGCKYDEQTPVTLLRIRTRHGSPVMLQGNSDYDRLSLARPRGAIKRNSAHSIDWKGRVAQANDECNHEGASQWAQICDYATSSHR